MIRRSLAAVTAVVALVASACTESTGISGTPGTIAKSLGDGQSVNITTSVPTSPKVTVKTAGGEPVRGAVVVFTTRDSGASVIGERATTNSDGVASPVGWNLGFRTGTQRLVAKVSGVTDSVVFTATGLALPATSITATTALAFGNAAIGTLIFPAVALRDRFGNPVVGDSVTFTADTTGYGLLGALASNRVSAKIATNASGVAVVPWSMGQRIGAQRLTASFPNLPQIQFTATAIAGAATAINLVENSFIPVAVSAAVPGTDLPVVQVADQFGNGISGLQVRFSIVSDVGGSLTGATVTSNAQGQATLGGWAVGSALGDKQLRVVLVSDTTISAIIRARAVAGGPSPFRITVVYQTVMSDSVRVAFEDASLRWAEIIRGGLPSVTLPSDQTCGTGNVRRSGTTVKDVVIFARVEAIDGVGAVLGSAGPCWVRGGTAGTPDGLPYIGQMRFDIADMPNLLTRGTLRDVILHEMGHVLGIGTLWNVPTLGFNFLLNPVPSPCNDANQDPRYTGAFAISRYTAFGGGRSNIPVENTNGCGTANGHWRERSFSNELMTGFINLAGNPLSTMTIGGLQDLGYTVNYAGANTYTIPGTGGTEVFAGPDAVAQAFTQGMWLNEAPLPPPRVLRKGQR